MTRIIETDDASANTSTLYAMLPGDEFFGLLDQGTSDWIAVTLEAGKTYSFGAVGMESQATGLTDPLLKLHAANGSLLAQNDDGGPGLFADLSYTATTSGTYYIEVKALSSIGDGVYGLVATEGDRPSYGIEMAGAVLYRPGSAWVDTPGTSVTLTWGVRASGPAEDASGHAAPFSVLTDAQIAATVRALGNYSDVANLTFEQVNPGGTTNSATILVGAYTSTTDGAGAYAQFPGSMAANKVAGDLWINNDSVSRTNIPVGSYDNWVFLHELGHAMGLAHPGDYNAAPGVSITYQNSAQFVEDSNQYTVMSYFDATDTEAKAPKSHCDTLMLDDIFALQQMYGANFGTRAGNDTYGFRSTIGGAYDFKVNKDPLLCIWDGAGTDTLNLSGFGKDQRIDLNQGQFSDVGGFKGNLSIALGAEIENAIGGRGSDTIFGNELNNRLKGGKGVDFLVGEGGNDVMSGNGGADGFVFVAGYGHDKITDFNLSQDFLSLTTDLWGGVNLTKTQMLNQFAHAVGGDLVLDFGADQLTLMHISSTAGLASQIVIS
ncbi:MAG: M10 family metallopeptidase C-terminal domain-containing protein [bacterium]